MNRFVKPLKQLWPRLASGKILSPQSFEESLSGSRLRLRPKRREDVAEDYAWQTNEELSRLDAASPLDCGFSDYLRYYSLEWSWRKQGFGIETLEGKHIGNCACFNVNRSRMEVEIGIIIGDRGYWNRGFGHEAICLLLDHLKRHRMKRVYLRTLDWNIRAQKCFERCGFVRYGTSNQDGHKFVLMEAALNEFKDKAPSEE
ncbi:MAG: GNAT family N-acetyltransferase [Chloroflexota bacterium]